jgi:hypothetical protein
MYNSALDLKLEHRVYLCLVPKLWTAFACLHHDIPQHLQRQPTQGVAHRGEAPSAQYRIQRAQQVSPTEVGEGGQHPVAPSWLVRYQILGSTGAHRKHFLDHGFMYRMPLNLGRTWSRHSRSRVPSFVDRPPSPDSRYGTAMRLQQVLLLAAAGLLASVEVEASDPKLSAVQSIRGDDSTLPTKRLLRSDTTVDDVGGERAFTPAGL